jgi:arylsulfatase A-like enzyme
MDHRILKTIVFLAVFGLVVGSSAAADKPNILVVWGDDIGQSNISAYTRGVVGYRTPNIDRIAAQGMLFTDYYGEQSCTAGRSSFITGQSVFRTGLSKVGLPGAENGMRKEDPSIAALLKAQGYATGQFGKNHLGDRDEHLPTNHGFDEFFGNLYHLNAEEEPENEDYPKDPQFRKKFGPRGVIHSWANADGTQKIEDTGPLTKKRMETVDDETSDRALEFIREQQQAGNPWFVWWNGTRMHFRTHVKAAHRGISGQDEYADGMVEHDMHIGKFLNLLDELNIADNTIVFYSTDNGPHYNTWPDAALRHSVVKRTPTGRAAGVCPPWYAGREKYRPVRSPMKSSTTWTGCRPFLQLPVIQTSRITSKKAVSRQSAGHIRCIWTDTTSCRC